MNSIVSLFIVLQIILFFLMTFHDWVHVPPLTNIRELKKHSTMRGRLITSTIFALIILIPLFLTWFYEPNYSFSIVLTIASFYGFLTIGTILSWWVPYFFGSSAQHKKDFAEYEETHHFLPARGDNVIPNTFHVIMHLLIWLCFAMSLCLLIL